LSGAARKGKVRGPRDDEPQRTYMVGKTHRKEGVGDSGTVLKPGGARGNA